MIAVFCAPICAPFPPQPTLMLAPITACVECPVLISSTATRRAWLIGMAKPNPMLPPWVPVSGFSPSVSIAASTPMTSPFAFTSGPPELPGLMGASVWMASKNTWGATPDDCPGCTGRSTALTMPLVTVSARPSGEPTAMTGSPTATPVELPSVRAGNRPTPSALMIAMSAYGSRPTSLPGADRPLLK
jgi:hypothetical protein